MVISSAQELAYAVNDRLRLGLTARPWNIYAAADTFWWLVPSTDWPAYRYGKLAFSLARDVPRKDLLGVNDSVLEVDKHRSKSRHRSSIHNGCGSNSLMDQEWHNSAAHSQPQQQTSTPTPSPAMFTIAKHREAVSRTR